jgi:hypothetical protein
VLRRSFRLVSWLSLAGALLLGSRPWSLSAAAGPLVMRPGHYCQVHEASCADPVLHTTPTGAYVGHDEPAVAFYANQPGAGNTVRYTLQLP